jgi:hypothetical protein
MRKRHCALLGFAHLSPHPIQSGSSSQIYDTTDWQKKQYKCMAIYMDGISCVQATGGGRRRGEVPRSQNEMTFFPASAGQITSTNFSTTIFFLAIRPPIRKVRNLTAVGDGMAGNYKVPLQTFPISCKIIPDEDA